MSRKNENRPYEPVDTNYGGEPGTYGGRQELSAITDINVRHGFIRKVFAILAVQLIVTTIIATATCQAFAHVDQRNPPASLMILQTLALAASVGTMLSLCCCPHVMREYPTNYMVLGIFTLGEAVLVGIICSQYTAQSVLVAFGLTAFIVTALMLFACQTKYDFTGLMPYFYIATLILFGLSVVLSFASMFGASQTGPYRTMYLLYAGAGALLFLGYIVLDTQLIIGGKNASMQIGIDDYCLAALNIYLDIIQLFLFILQLLGDRRD